jgi:hypothetical protein
MKTNDNYFRASTLVSTLSKRKRFKRSQRTPTLLKIETIGIGT